VSNFTRQVRRQWAKDPNRPSLCTCQPEVIPWDRGEVVLQHQPWCRLHQRHSGGPDGVVLSVRGPGYGRTS
jgi:hypothetical protein